MPGGTINLDGTTITAPAVADTPPPITIGSQVVTANAQDQYFVGSQTLTPGGAIDVSGTPVSLAPGGTQVVVGTSSVGLGPYIFGGLGARPSGGPGNGTAGTVPSLESADGALKGARWSVGALGVLMGLVVWL